MALQSFELHTITCDHPDCAAKQSSATIESLFEDGWASENIYGKDICLCPLHNRELQDWLGIHIPAESQPIDAGSGQDWAGVPTPSTKEMTSDANRTAHSS